MKTVNLDPNSKSEIEIVAQRMRLTLIDVMGEDLGSNFYSLEWIEERLKWHLELKENARVILVKNETNEILGHAIIRKEVDDKQNDYGFFSTIYVIPEMRQKGVAKLLIDEVLTWCALHKLNYTIYNTANNNFKLINLLEQFGFKIIEQVTEMVCLRKDKD